jgi:hypothetical protein
MASSSPIRSWWRPRASSASTRSSRADSRSSSSRGGLRLGERLVGELRQRPPAPQPQRLAQQPHRRRRVAHGRGRTALADQPLGQPRVHQVGRCLQPVPGGVGNDLHPFRGLERAPQPQHIVLQRVGGRPGRMLAPQRLGQLVLGDRLAQVHGEHREQAALLGRAKPHRPLRPHQLQRPQDPKHRSTRHALSVADSGRLGRRSAIEASRPRPRRSRPSMASRPQATRQGH